MVIAFQKARLTINKTIPFEIGINNVSTIYSLIFDAIHKFINGMCRFKLYLIFYNDLNTYIYLNYAVYLQLSDAL